MARRVALEMPRIGTTLLSDGPREFGTDAGYLARLDKREASKQPAVATLSEAGKVERSFVHVLEERRVGVDEAVRLKDAMNLGYDASRIENVLEHRLNHHAIDACIGQGDEVRVGDELRKARRIHVERDHVELRIIVQLLEATSDGAAADDENNGSVAYGCQ